MLKAVRLDRLKTDLPVLVCSGSREKEDYQRLAQYGIQGILMKPIKRDELTEKVRDAFAKTG